MFEYENIYDGEFFIIDSENINSIKTKLYGFMINDDKIIKNDNLDEMTKITGEGVYLYIHNDEDKDEISIYQDFNGCYGIYLFQDNNYFAISNSFLKLSEYLKYNHYLTLNNNYAIQLLVEPFVSEIFEDTLINEIKTLPRQCVITIDKKFNKVFFKKINYHEHSIDLDTIKGINILDSWFNKWINIIRNIKKKTNNIQLDLSGGFDSRITLVLFLNANI